MWVPNKDDEDQNKSAGQQTNTSIGAGAGGSAPLGSGEGNQTITNPSTLSPVSQVPQQKPASVQDYLSANKQQGENLAGKFNSKLDTTFNNEKSAITSAGDAAKSAAISASVYNPDIVKNSLDNPTSTLNDSSKLSSFLKQWNGAYSGPSSFENTPGYNGAASASNEAKTKAEQIKDVGGRKQLLQDDFGVYGQGNKGLDQTLLQNSSKFGETQNLAPKFDSIQTYLGKTADEVNSGTIPLAKSGVATNATRAKSEFDKGTKDFQADVNSRAIGKIDPANLQLWNDVAGAYTQERGSSVKDSSPTDLARYFAASAEDRQKSGGLARLAGSNDSFLPSVPTMRDTDELRAIMESLKKK